MQPLTITPQEACERLQKSGLKIGYDKLRNGMQQDTERVRKVFPFADAIKMDGGGWAYLVYIHDLDEFIRLHGGRVGEEA